MGEEIRIDCVIRQKLIVEGLGEPCHWVLRRVGEKQQLLDTYTEGSSYIGDQSCALFGRNSLPIVLTPVLNTRAIESSTAPV